MRTVWMASVVFLLGALACAVQQRHQVALLLATAGFELVFVADSNIDWTQRITKNNWRRSLLELQWQTTVLGKLSQALAYVCLFFFFVLAAR